MTREQHLKLADDAVTRAERLAGDAERYSNHPDYPHKVASLAAAGALWSDIARTHAAIADATDKPFVVVIDEVPLLIGGAPRTGNAAQLAELLVEIARAGRKDAVASEEIADV